MGTRVHRGKHSTTVVHKNQQGKLINTKSTTTIKRGRYWKLNFTETLNKIAEYNFKILKCTATIKTLPVIIAKRQSYFRNHVDNQTKCESRRFKAKMVMTGKMGSYEGVQKRLKQVVKDLGAQITKAKNDKKAVNGLERMKLKANHFLNDLAYKMWSQDFNMYEIR